MIHSTSILKNDVAFFSYLILAFPKKFFLAHIVDAQDFAHANQNAALEGSDSQWHVIHRGFVHKLKGLATVRHPVRADTASSRTPRIQTDVFPGADQNKLLLRPEEEEERNKGKWKRGGGEGRKRRERSKRNRKRSERGS